MRRSGALRGEFSLKRLRPIDVCTGALRVAAAAPRLRVDRRWLWSERGSAAVSRRLDRVLRARGAGGPFLEVGTLAAIDPALGAHYVLTDMTIPQAARAARFEFASFSRAQLERAIATQGRVLARAAHVFTLSEWARASVRDDFGLPAARVTAVYAGSNLELPPGLREPRAGREILFVGIDWERKGGPLLLEAFARVRRELPDATLRIVGCRPSIRDPAIRVEGFLDRRVAADFERLCRCYLRASCFCLPAHFDPFPNAIIEAAAAGLPTVAIDNGSRAEAVQHGVTGVLAGDASADAIADALIAVLADAEHCAALGRAARALAAREFTWGRVLERIGGPIAAAS
jgi:glycosyltransferase involved in cell wall biosynthesis